MSAPDVSRREYVSIYILCVVVAILMATIALKIRAPFGYLLLAMPYVFLVSIWMAFRNAYKRTSFTKNNSEEQNRALLNYLRSAVQMLTIFGSVGIATALAMGFLLGRLGSH